MPKDKKGKKGKKDKKGKKKDEEKEESITKMAERNSNIWEARLRMTEFHKDHYKETARQLVEENTSLIDYMKQTEKDTIDVVSYLRKLDSDKENEINVLKEELRNIRSVNQAEKDMIVNEFNMKLNDLQDKLDKKSNEYDLIQNELNQLKEFRKKKIQMQKELEEIKEAMILNEKEHRDQTQRIEEKFFEEKMRLQIEANKKIEELAEKAHDAAVKNLDDITRNVYKENLQLTESFKISSKEIENLKKINKTLQTENDRLSAQFSDNSSLVRDKVDLAAKQGKQIKELQNKIEILEKSLSQVVREFETERESIINRCKTELESGSIELEKLRKTLELKNKEMNKIKKLAKNILEQRSDIERFFLDSLDYVRKQIITNRNEYRQEANRMYNNRMLAAQLGQIEFPKVKTFSKSFEAFSTNNVYKDLEQASKWLNLEDVIDLNDLTWEQKEQVLRELFARMNGIKPKNDRTSQNMALVKLDDAIEDDDIIYMDKRNITSNKINNNSNLKSQNSAKTSVKHASDDFTFITQANPVDDVLSNRTQDANTVPKLPPILS